jgi:nicotinamide mononucleotide transporter
MTNLEIFAVVLSVIAVTLTVKKHLWCWGFNWIAAGVYGYLFYQYQLYAEVVLQGFFMLMAVYGFLTWKKTQQIQQTQKLSIHTAVWQLLISITCGGVFGWLLHSFTQAALPLLDASLAALSLLATYWTSRKYVATWLLWIVVDIVYVGMFIYKDLLLTAALYAGFVGLAVWGLMQWQQSRLNSRLN